jgi:hypothetical protein
MIARPVDPGTQNVGPASGKIKENIRQIETIIDKNLLRATLLI